MRPGAADIKPGPAAKEATGVRASAGARRSGGNCRRLAEAPRRGVGGGDLRRGANRVGPRDRPSGGGAGCGARAGEVCPLFLTRGPRARAGGRARGREGSVAGRWPEPVSGVRALGGVLPCGMDNEAFLRSNSITSSSSQEPAAAATT